MRLVDEAEYQRWVATAERNLAMARTLRENAYHEGAVFNAEMAAQCGLKALLHGVGEKAAARGHGLLALAHACEAHAGLALGDEHRQDLGRLAADYQTSRYPDALGAGTPAEHFGSKAADIAIVTAERTLEAVRVAHEALVRPPDSDDEADPA